MSFVTSSEATASRRVRKGRTEKKRNERQRRRGERRDKDKSAKKDILRHFSLLVVFFSVCSNLLFFSGTPREGERHEKMSNNDRQSGEYEIK